jgi:hypothetical protein
VAYRVGKRSLHRPEVCDLCANIGEMTGSKFARLSARVLCRIG